MRSGVQFPVSLQRKAWHEVPGFFVSVWSCKLAYKRQDETKKPIATHKALRRLSVVRPPPRGITAGNSRSRYKRKPGTNCRAFCLLLFVYCLLQWPVCPSPCHHICKTGTSSNNIRQLCICPFPWPESGTPFLFLAADYTNEPWITVPPAEHWSS